MKFLLALTVLLLSAEAFSARSWKKNGFHTVERASNLPEYRELRRKYPEVFIQEINEAQFKSAKVETTGWSFIGSTVCEPNDPRLEEKTHKATLCLKDPSIPIPLCTFSLGGSPKDIDPCLEN